MIIFHIYSISDESFFCPLPIMVQYAVSQAKRCHIFMGKNIVSGTQSMPPKVSRTFCYYLEMT